MLKLQHLLVGTYPGGRLQRHVRRGLPAVRMPLGEVLDQVLQRLCQRDLRDLHPVHRRILPDSAMHGRGQHRLPGLHRLRGGAVRESGVRSGLGHGVLRLQCVRGRTVHRRRVSAQRERGVLSVWNLCLWVLSGITMQLQYAYNVCCMSNYMPIWILPEQHRELQPRARVSVPAVHAAQLPSVRGHALYQHVGRADEGLHDLLPYRQVHDPAVPGNVREL